MFSLTQPPEVCEACSSRFKRIDANGQSEEHLSGRHVGRVHPQRGSFDPPRVFEFLQAAPVINLRISLCARMGIVSHLDTFLEETIYCSAGFHFKLNQPPSVHLEVQTTLRLPSALARSSQNYAVSTARFSVTTDQWRPVNLFQSTELVPDSINLNN